MAVAIVPDPNVPRYRRLFDLEIQAITLGMLNDGYVLDRYVFPWNTGNGEKDGRPPPGSDPNPGAFGLLVFRCDGWREHVCQDPATLPAESAAVSGQTTRVRAIYIVTDTATWGVATRPLTCATKRIRAQLAGTEPVPDADLCPVEAPAAARSLGPPGKAVVELLQYPGSCESGRGQKPLVLLGPNFSGGMDSVGQNVARLLGPEITDFCLVSSSATNSSNPLAEDAYDHMKYVQLAADDGVKLLRLADLAEAFGYFDPAGKKIRGKPGDPRYDVAFLTEASTFGYGVCNPWGEKDSKKIDRIREFCRRAFMLSFPAAVADIRYGIEQQREKQQNEVQIGGEGRPAERTPDARSGRGERQRVPREPAIEAHGSESAAGARSRARAARAIRSEDGGRRRYRCPRSPVPVRSTSPTPAERHAHRPGNGHPARAPGFSACQSRRGHGRLGESLRAPGTTLRL